MTDTAALKDVSSLAATPPTGENKEKSAPPLLHELRVTWVNLKYPAKGLQKWRTEPSEPGGPSQTQLGPRDLPGPGTNERT